MHVLQYIDNVTYLYNICKPRWLHSCNIDVYVIWPFNNDFSTTAL